MHATLGEIIQLTIDAIVGYGLSVSMDKNGISIFCRETREKAICLLIIFVCAWIIGMALLFKILGD